METDHTKAEPPRGLTRALAGTLGHLAASELTSEALAGVKARLTHSLRVSLVSSQLPPGLVALRAVGGAGGDCSVIGRAETLSAPDAAFVNGVIGHSSLQEDCGPGGLREGSHPATFVLPAALAAAESSQATGAQLIRGILLGYETVSRLGTASPTQIVDRRFRPLAVMGPFGAAAAVCGVHGWSGQTLASALDIAGNMAAGSTQGIFEGTMEPYFQAGMAARNGLLAAQLAHAGAETAVESLEGPFGFFETYGGTQGDAAELTAPRDRLGVSRVGSKRYAACLQNQETIALIARDLSQTLEAGEIDRVVLTRPARGTHGLNSPGVSRVPPFGNMLQAQMSARFTAAAALLGCPVEDPRFFQSSFADPTITDLAARIELVPVDDERITVSIETTGGHSIELTSEGSDTLFPDADILRERFLHSAEQILGDTARPLLAMIENLEHLTDVRELTALLRVDSTLGAPSGPDEPTSSRTKERADG
jgi:2-methylcitrate dehydratase PrpD